MGAAKGCITAGICKIICKEIKTFGKVEIHFHPHDIHSSMWWCCVFTPGRQHLTRKRRVILIVFGCRDFHNRSRGLENRSYLFIALVIIQFCTTTRSDTKLHYVRCYHLRHHSCVYPMNRTIQEEPEETQCIFRWILRGDVDLFCAICPFHCLAYETWERSQYPPQQSPLKHSALYVVAHC